jgi:HK97 family phage portal protein
MKLGPLSIGWSRKEAVTMSLDTLIRRLEAAYETFSGVSVSPENCMQSPTVHAIVTAISRRIATLPVKVLKRSASNGRTRTEDQPNHPIAKLLQNPNGWQDRTTFWLDATSALIRCGNFYAFKARGATGPIRSLIPLIPSAVSIEQDEQWNVLYRATLQNSTYKEMTPEQVFHARGAARDMLKGDSPVVDVREAIALEITAERMGASVFGNSATPGMVFKHGSTSAGFESEEEEKAFIEQFQKAYATKGRFKAMVLPFGMEMDSVPVDNDKAQFLATRQYQRSVIAGAFGVPPHLVGDLSKAAYNSVEQQSLDFVLNVILPYVRIFESSMERSLLTQEDRNAGMVIRFDLESALRGDFKSQQEGLKIQREMGVINPNEWREAIGRNPINDDDGGELYWMKGPSGQGADAPPADPAKPEDEKPADEAEGADNDRNA